MAYQPTNRIRKSERTLTPKQMRRERGGAFGRADADTVRTLAQGTANEDWIVGMAELSDRHYAETHVTVTSCPPAPKVKPAWMTQG